MDLTDYRASREGVLVVGAGLENLQVGKTESGLETKDCTVSQEGDFGWCGLSLAYFPFPHHLRDFVVAEAWNQSRGFAEASVVQIFDVFFVGGDSL